MNSDLAPLHDLRSTQTFGAPLTQARMAVILIHGRGSSPEDMAPLAQKLMVKDCTYLAPSARDGTWYPNRFFVPLEQNEPWLSSALEVVEGLVQSVLAAAIPSERIGIIGFSQGACLALESAARHPRRLAFVGGLSGALIGPLGLKRIAGDLKRTPILLGCAAHDPHIPLEYVESSADVLSAMGAAVEKEIFPSSAHTVFDREIEWLKRQFDRVAHTRDNHKRPAAEPKP